MSIKLAAVAPPREILAVVTVGRWSHARKCFALQMPLHCADCGKVALLEVCRSLAARGHIIRLACLDGSQDMAEKYPFISLVHVIGRCISPEEDEMYHHLLEDSDMHNAKGRSDVIKVLMFMESFWTETHRNLDQVVLNRRPDLIFGDVLDLQACTDVANKHSIPLATMHPQVPFNLPAPGYMPGIPGFQQRCLTSEHASLWDRLYEQMFAVKLIFSLRHFILWRTKMRRDAGMPRAGLVRQPRHLYLINAFFGLDVSRELPPLVVPVGPLMYHDFPPLDQAMEQFLLSHKRTI